jgi:hypothetical protein
MRRLVLVSCVFAAAVLSAQSSDRSSQLLLDNDIVRVSRVATAPARSLRLDPKTDAVLVRLADGSATFFPKGTAFEATSSGSEPAIDFVIELKKHWDAEVHACEYPRQCTRETRLGNETVAWTTTLFTNGFITATQHRLVLHATLDSSYYSAKGTDKILVIPFTGLQANFGGAQEELKSGEPYFTNGTDVEVTAPESEARWLVLRINMPKQ